MVPRLAGVAALLFAATVLFAQDAKKVKIEFVGEGERLVWIQSKGKEHTVPEHQTVSGKAVDLDVPAETAGKSVYVCDINSGDVSVKALDQVVKAGTWQVKSTDATMTYRVIFGVLHDDKPVTTAVVHMKTKDETLDALLTGADKGVTIFNLVPFGDVEVSVDYKTGGEAKSLSAQTFTVKPGMEDVDQPFKLTIDDEVETVEPEKEKESGEGEGKEAGAGEKKEEEPPKTNAFSTIFNMLIGLLVIGGISYAIWRYVQSNPDKAADILKKGGVHVPGDTQDPVMAPKKAGPPQQIILGDAAPTPAEPLAAAGPVVKNPRLVKADGSLYIVQDGEQVVGREGGELKLAGESSVSRSHAKISKAGDTITVEDMGSTNGTFVNGQRLSGPVSLQPGDAVQFGAVQYRYEE